jgi:hypothetical protein
VFKSTSVVFIDLEPGIRRLLAEENSTSIIPRVTVAIIIQELSHFLRRRLHFV